jgi:hypothetical protein
VPGGFFFSFFLFSFFFGGFGGGGGGGGGIIVSIFDFPIVFLGFLYPQTIHGDHFYLYLFILFSFICVVRIVMSGFKSVI